MSSRHIQIDNFPNDGQLRVVWAYGAVFPSNNPESTNISVEVALRLIHNDKVSDREIAEVYTVPIAELDAVRLGSLWEGRREAKKTWNGFLRGKRKVDFSFDFEATKINHVCFNTESPLSNEQQKRFWIPPFVLNLKCIPYDKRYHFFNSRLTLLTTRDGLNVLIPSLELFTSTYTPEHKGIRRSLMSSDINSVIDEFVKTFEIEGENPEKYVLRTKKSHTNTNIEFLAYLALNPITKQRVSKIWASLNAARSSAHKERYPVVEPYHPRYLDLCVDGIQIDKNTFLVLRVTNSSHPIEHEITQLCTSSKVSPSENKLFDNEGKDKNKTYESDDDALVTDTTNPSANMGKTRVVTSVQSSGKSLVKKVAEGEQQVESQVSKTKGSGEAENVPPKQVSSGEPSHSKDSVGTQRLEHGEEKKRTLFEQIHNSLRDLVMNKAYNEVKSYYFINEWAKEVEQRTFIKFPKGCVYADRGEYNWWITLKHSVQALGDKKQHRLIYRRVLLVKITLINGDYAYLLEIERRSPSESFQGLLFNVNEPLHQKSIHKLLSVIARNKGMYKQKLEDGSFVKRLLGLEKSMTFQHQLDGQASIDANFMRKVIDKGIKAGIFVKQGNS